MKETIIYNGVRSCDIKTTKHTWNTLNAEIKPSLRRN